MLPANPGCGVFTRRTPSRGAISCSNQPMRLCWRVAKHWATRSCSIRSMGRLIITADLKAGWEIRYRFPLR